MYAVIDDRNQQFRAEPGKRVQIAHNEALEPGASITFENVCLVAGGESGRIGAPYCDGVTVTGKVIGPTKGPKVIIQKIRRRKNSRRRTGFRAKFTEVQIETINGI